MNETKDFYYILGIKRDANKDEIKSAYRKLSLKFHPDHNNGDKFFEERFKEITDAYKTLSNDEMRIIYDETLLSKIKDSNYKVPAENDSQQNKQHDFKKSNNNSSNSNYSKPSEQASNRTSQSKKKSNGLAGFLITTAILIFIAFIRTAIRDSIKNDAINEYHSSMGSNVQTQPGYVTDNRSIVASSDTTHISINNVLDSTVDTNSSYTNSSIPNSQIQMMSADTMHYADTSSKDVNVYVWDIMSLELPPQSRHAIIRLTVKELIDIKNQQKFERPSNSDLSKRDQYYAIVNVSCQSLSLKLYDSSSILLRRFDLSNVHYVLDGNCSDDNQKVFKLFEPNRYISFGKMRMFRQDGIMNLPSLQFDIMYNSFSYELGASFVVPWPLERN